MKKDSPETSMFIALVMLGAGLGGFVASNHPLPNWLTLSCVGVASLQAFLNRRALWPIQIDGGRG